MLKGGECLHKNYQTLDIHPWLDEGLKSAVVNRTCHSINEESLEIISTIHFQ